MSTLSPYSLSPRQIVYLAVFIAVVLNGALMPFTVGQTYDAYIHMFFGDHYHRSWFDPWEPRWYTGFTMTSYPPGSHQLIGLLMYIVPLKAAFILVQLASVSIAIIGVYRFSRLWVGGYASAFAALSFAVSSSLAETIHIFGQLPTTLAIGIFLNATPHVYGWIAKGRLSDIPLALIFTAGATAAHHVTPIFATLLFVAPLGLHAWLDSLIRTEQRGLHRKLTVWETIAAPVRGVALGGAILMVIILVVFPYWYWSITDPITQVAIPHGSRESFLERPDLGLMFFVIPWGMMILVLPYVVWKMVSSRLWPLAMSVMLCFVLGTGGTTPIPETLLGPAFHILTLDRFTFWGTLLILPFAGLLIENLVSGRAYNLMKEAFGAHVTRLSLAALAMTYGFVCIGISSLPLLRPTQPDFLDPGPIIQFMQEDSHNDWRYLTLGFGDQFAYHSAFIDALSVDGNYHSARRLPDMTSYSVERLENAKYLGVPGLDSLQQFLVNANDYHLKYIFSNDEFYDPVLYYSGWNRILRLRNGVVVWEKPAIEPLPARVPRREIKAYQRYMWGTIPPLSLALMALSLIVMAIRGNLLDNGNETGHLAVADRAEIRQVWLVRIVASMLTLVACAGLAAVLLRPAPPLTPTQVAEHYYIDLDFRRFEKAFDRLDPSARGRYEDYLRTLRSRGGLIFSYSKLLDVDIREVSRSDDVARLEADLTYLTSLSTERDTRIIDLVRDGDDWVIVPDEPAKTLTGEVVRRSAAPSFRDLTVAARFEGGAVARNLSRPELAFTPPQLVTRNERLHVIGEVRNLSTDPACLRLDAVARDETGAVLQRQHMGSLGAHRLLPGARSAYRIDFEGVLKIGDAPITAGYDPEHYSLPEFEGTPADIRIEATSLVCEAPDLFALVLQGFAATPDGLDLTIESLDPRSAAVVQVRAAFHDEAGRLAWVAPTYLPTNLIPGGTFRLHLDAAPGREVNWLRSLELPQLNGRNAAALEETDPSSPRLFAPEHSGFSYLTVETHAMPFEPTF